MYLACCVWVYALVQSLPPLFGWGSYGLESGNISCSVSWEIHDSNTHNDSYIVFLFTLGFIMPIIIIFSSYLGIIIKLKRARQRVGNLLFIIFIFALTYTVYIFFSSFF